MDHRRPGVSSPVGEAPTVCQHCHQPIEQRASFGEDFWAIPGSPSAHCPSSPSHVHEPLLSGEVEDPEPPTTPSTISGAEPARQPGGGDAGDREAPAGVESAEGVAPDADLHLRPPPPTREAAVDAPRSLTIRLEPDDLDGGWVASVAEMPGTLSDGETTPEALRNIADALEGVLAAEAEPVYVPRHARTTGDDQ